MKPLPLNLEGGCQCGAVRYRIAGHPHHLTLCHCTVCRGVSGAPAVAWFSVPASGFTLLQGSPRTYRSSETASRSFCRDCGTQLTFKADDLPEIDVTTCSLDMPEALPPEDQTFVRSRLQWLSAIPDLPEHDSVRPPESSEP
ncbi:MAG: GFA family protein [Alcaligenaceae bacterium]|nr:MAG: GFA family protein [Alcaligenaceae bacterium]